MALFLSSLSHLVAKKIEKSRHAPKVFKDFFFKEASCDDATVLKNSFFECQNEISRKRSGV